MAAQRGVYTSEWLDRIAGQAVFNLDWLCALLPNDGKIGSRSSLPVVVRLVERVERMPGVQVASLTTAVPLGKRFPILFTFAADELDPESLRIEDLVAQFRAVGPGLQRVFGLAC